MACAAGDALPSVGKLDEALCNAPYGHSFAQDPPPLQKSQSAGSASATDNQPSLSSGPSPATISISFWKNSSKNSTALRPKRCRKMRHRIYKSESFSKIPCTIRASPSDPSLDRYVNGGVEIALDTRDRLRYATMPPPGRTTMTERSDELHSGAGDLAREYPATLGLPQGVRIPTWIEDITDEGRQSSPRRVTGN